MASYLSGSTRRARLAGTTLVNALVVVSVVLVNLLQSPGRVTFDSKLDLQLAPGEFMSRSLSAWNPDALFGELQNQASGFIFPIGTVFWIGDGLGVPMWVWERLWSALVMLLAYEGARRLSRAWAGASPGAAVVAGLAYMLAPRVLTTVGGLTGETLPTAVLPWTVLPLVLYATGRLPRWTALVASAATVPFMGGQNATEVIATLVLPFFLLWFATSSWRARAASLLPWSGLVLVASLWWLVPLFVLGRYSPPFLDYIESARNTTGVLGWFAVLRGTDHWVAFLPGGSTSGWVAGAELVAAPLLVASTALAAAVGLVGLIWRRPPFRGALVLSLLVGFFVMTAGRAGFGAPFASTWLDLLDGPLAPFRNVHKFDPLVRLPLAIGLAAVVTSCLRGEVVRRVWALRVTAALAVGAVLVTATPALAGQLRDPEGFERIPAAWSEAADHLAAAGRQARVLVLPGSGFAIQRWGRTIDNPLQVLDPPPWGQRNQTPLAPEATIAVQDSIEDLLAQGRPSRGLAPLLASMGVTHLLVRNDLDPAATDAPAPQLVHQVLDKSPGISRDRGFGDAGNGYPLVEVYRIARSTADSRVDLVSWADRRTVNGHPSALLDLADAGLLEPGRALVVDRSRLRRSSSVLTDADVWHERNFGRVHDARSDAMTAEAGFRIHRARHNYLGETPDGRPVAVYRGIADVEASSSGGYASAAGAVDPAEAPFAALDDSLLTAWVSSPLTEAEGQWIELELEPARSLGLLDLKFDVTGGAEVRRIRVSTDRGSVEAPVDGRGVVNDLRLPRGTTRSLRVTVTTVRGASLRRVRLADMRIRGLDISRAVTVPGLVDRGTTVVLTSAVGRRACFRHPAGLDCNGDRVRFSTEQAGFERRIAVRDSGRWNVEGWAAATGGADVASLFEPVLRRRVNVAATSFWGGDPALVPAHAFDGEPLTSWLAAEADERPVLALSWAGKQKISSVRASLLPGQPGRTPARIRVESDEGVQVVDNSGRAPATFAPVRTRHLRLTLLPSPGVRTTSPVGVSELEIGGLQDLRYSPDLDSPTGTVCGLGPTVEVDGDRLRTRVSGTLRDVLDGSPLRLTSCDGPIRLEAGDAVVEVDNKAGFAVSMLTLEPRAATAVAQPQGGDAEVEEWGATERKVSVRAEEDSLLVVRQSFNTGWTAEIGGRRLQARTADGWAQAWLVPAGAEGTVVMRYAPQPVFVAGVLGGLAAAAILVGAAVVMLWRLRKVVPRVAGTLVEDEPESGWGLLLGGVLLVVLGALASIPFGIGLVAGLFAKPTWRRGVMAVSAVSLAVAATLALTHLDSSTIAPTSADVLTAATVGLVLGVLWRGGASLPIVSGRNR